MTPPDDALETLGIITAMLFSALVGVAIGVAGFYIFFKLQTVVG